MSACSVYAWRPLVMRRRAAGTARPRPARVLVSSFTIAFRRPPYSAQHTRHSVVRSLRELDSITKYIVEGGHMHAGSLEGEGG
jgi:hypothetical protein